MASWNSARAAGMVGMLGSLVFKVGLIVEYRDGLFPPGAGSAFVINQLTFLAGMLTILAMVWGLGRARAAGDGRFGRVALGLFFAGMALLIAGGIFGLATGEYEQNLFFPLGALGLVVGGLLTGIAVLLTGRWLGWQRYAPLLVGIYYLLVMMILPPLLTGRNEPTFLTESLWMAAWFLLGLALLTTGRPAPPAAVKARP